MNRVFEDFVVVALRESLGLSERGFRRARGVTLSISPQGGRVRLKPDISWWERGRCVFVGDVKYKRLKFAGYENADLYQLLAYTTATNLGDGLLIYAAGEAESAIYEARGAGKRLEVLALDLAGDPVEILSQVATVAKRIRRLAVRVPSPIAQVPVARTVRPARVRPPAVSTARRSELLGYRPRRRPARSGSPEICPLPLRTWRCEGLPQQNVAGARARVSTAQSAQRHLLAFPERARCAGAESDGDCENLADRRRAAGRHRPNDACRSVAKTSRASA